MRILLDMDGVVADFMGPWLKQYNYLTGEKVTLNDIHGLNTKKYVGDPFTLNKIKDSVGFIRNLPPLPGAIDGVETLHRLGHDVVFVSNGTNCPTSGHEKRDWLKFYFSKLWQFPKLVLTYHKYLVKGDCLVDDHPRNLENLDPSCAPLLWHQKYNSNITGYTGYTRIYDWSNLLDWVSRQ